MGYPVFEGGDPAVCLLHALIGIIPFAVGALCRLLCGLSGRTQWCCLLVRSLCRNGCLLRPLIDRIGPFGGLL
jgi:hypothetical protein